MLSYGPWTYAAKGPIAIALDAIELPTAEAITSDLDKAIALAARPGRDIQALTWGVGPQMQRHLVSLWRSGYDLGGLHGWGEMQAAVDNETRSQFALDPQTLSIVAALLTGEPGLIIPLNLEQAILNRALAIATTYSTDILNKLKTVLIGASIPQGGAIISRAELETKIQGILNVGKARAETIARNELTYAYNTARVQVFRQSSLVTHVRFLAIDDARTTQICRSRNGMLISMGDAIGLAGNRPPLHHRCRSMLSPVMPLVSELHQSWVDDPKTLWDAKDREPLPNGWRV